MARKMVEKDADYYELKADEAAERVKHFSEIEQKYREQAQERREKERIEQVSAFAEEFEKALVASGIEAVKLTSEIGREAAAAYVATREIGMPYPREKEKKHD